MRAIRRVCAVLNRAAAGAALATLSAAGWCAPLVGPYRLQDISNGGEFQNARAISNTGAVIGTSEFGPLGFYWSPEAGLTQIPDPVLPGGNPAQVRTRPYGLDINGLGVVAGGWAPGLNFRPIVYSPASGTRDLGLDDAVSRSITDAGRVLGLRWRNGAQEYFIAEPDGAVTYFQPPVPMHAFIGLRDDGVIVGVRQETGRPFSSVAGLIDGDGWQDLPGIGGYYRSQTVGFNQQGAVVGLMGVDVPEAGIVREHAFAYTPEGGLIDLALQMTGDVLYSSAQAVNRHGLVVGYGARGPDWQPFSFIHDLASGSFLDLATVLWPGTADGWTNMVFFDVNDSGQIAGWGVYDGGVRAFVLTPTPPVPEPATLAMVIVGLGVVGVAGRRRRR